MYIYTSSNPVSIQLLKFNNLGRKHFFFYLAFLSRTFTNDRIAGEGGGHLFISSLPLPPFSQKLRLQLGDYCRALTSAGTLLPRLQAPLGFTPIGLNPNLSPLGLNTDPFSALEKIQKHCRCNFFFLLNISEIYRIPS